MKLTGLLVLFALVSGGSFLVGRRAREPKLFAATPPSQSRVDSPLPQAPQSTARNIDELAAELRDKAGLGPRLIELHRSNPEAALRTVQRACGLDSKSDFVDGILASPEVDETASGVTLIAASLIAIERAEMQQGAVISDTGWMAPSAASDPTRTLLLRIDGVAVRIDQVRRGDAQSSAHSWSVSGGIWPFEYKYHGKGSDRLLPIADASGAPAAYLLISHYKTDYRSALTQLRKAMADWRRRAERLTREDKR